MARTAKDIKRQGVVITLQNYRKVLPEDFTNDFVNLLAQGRNEPIIYREIYGTKCIGFQSEIESL